MYVDFMCTICGWRWTQWRFAYRCPHCGEERKIFRFRNTNELSNDINHLSNDINHLSKIIINHKSINKNGGARKHEKRVQLRLPDPFPSGILSRAGQLAGLGVGASTVDTPTVPA